MCLQCCTSLIVSLALRWRLSVVAAGGRPRDSLQQLQLRSLLQSSLRLQLINDDYFQKGFQTSMFSFLFFFLLLSFVLVFFIKAQRYLETISRLVVRLVWSGLVWSSFMFVIVVLSPPRPPRPVCAAVHAPSAVCHIRCVRTPVG